MGDSGAAPSVPPQGCHPRKCRGHFTAVTGRRAARGGTSALLSCQPSTAMSPRDGGEVAWGHLAQHMVAPTGTQSGDTQPQAGSTACSGTDCAVKKPQIYRVLTQGVTLQCSPLALSDPSHCRARDSRQHGTHRGNLGTLRGCPGGSVGLNSPQGHPVSGSTTAESHRARQEPGESHKSRGYTRAFSLAVFDRDTKFNFLGRALNPRLSLLGGCDSPGTAPRPAQGRPPAPHRSTAGGCKDGR